MLEFQKDQPVLYTQLSGLWILQGNADTIFIDSTGRTVFEWHPRRTLKPRCVARTLVRRLPTFPISIRIYSSRLVSSIDPSKIPSSPSHMSPKRPRWGPYSDVPVDHYWPILDYGEPCEHKNSRPNVEHGTKGKMHQPAHIRKGRSTSTAGIPKDKDRVARPETLSTLSLGTSSDSKVALASMATPASESFRSSADRQTGLENQIVILNSQRAGALKRRKDTEEDDHDDKRQRTSYNHEDMQLCHRDEDAVARVKKVDGGPLLKRRRDIDDKEELIIKRQRHEPKDEDLDMCDVDWELDIDI